MQRVILHCDMNNFYASVECMLNPELKNKPVAVCGSVEERHGIVLAKNYAAKAFGVSTGEAIWQAKQKCQDLVIVEPHYEQYMKFSKLAREIYGRYTDQIEPYGMDECWLDVTGSGCTGTGFEIADEIRRTVKFDGTHDFRRSEFQQDFCQAWVGYEKAGCDYLHRSRFVPGEDLVSSCLRLAWSWQSDREDSVRLWDSYDWRTCCNIG